MRVSEYNVPSDRPIFNKTKIICTIGPKSQSVETLGKLVQAGMNVMRMNFSHGNHDYHAQTIKNLRTYLASCKKPKIVAILLDTKGPEIRSGKLQNPSGVKLVEGQKFTLTTDMTTLGDENHVAVTYQSLCKSVNVGDVILMDDGLLGFRVDEINATENYLRTTVMNSGILGETKGVNLPGASVDLPPITDKDRSDIMFGIEQGIDLIAASFIRKASDVLEIRELIKHTNIQIISKIENQEGLNNFDEILAVSDGIMVARGDLGVEIPVEQVARAQKMMIRKCNIAGKAVITATQMLESMVVNPRPTRAEATDVANAVLDGTDCVMLSGETAKGAYPIEAVKMMSSICLEAEADINYTEIYNLLQRHVKLPISISEAIASGAVKTSWDVHAALIVVLTETGTTARSISKYRPIPPVLAVTACPQTARQLQVLRGIYPFLTDTMRNTDNIVRKASLHAVKMEMAMKGDPCVVTSGYLEATAGSTNIMKVIRCSEGKYSPPKKKRSEKASPPPKEDEPPKWSDISSPVER